MGGLGVFLYMCAMDLLGVVMRGVIYARVSKEELDPENQIVMLRSFAEKHGIEIVGEFVEKTSGYETKPEDREIWVKAVDAARENNAAILVFSIDRIARRYEYLLRTLDSLRDQNIQVISLQESWLEMLATISDQTLRALIYDIIVRVMAYTYQMYVESLREKTKAALIKAKMAGKHIGRPPAIPDEKLAEYLAKYKGHKLKTIWKIAVADGYKISYKRFLLRVRELKKKMRQKK